MLWKQNQSSLLHRSKRQRISRETFEEKPESCILLKQKILIVPALRGERSVAEICRKHGIAESMFYKWNKEFLEAGKKRLAGDTAREATSGEVAELRKENQRLKEMVADLMLRYDIVKKTPAILK
jgi:transposase